MRRYEFLFLNLLFTSTLLRPAGGFCADMAIGSRPDSYNADSKANSRRRRLLIEQYRCGAIKFPEYKSGLDQLTHPVGIVFGSSSASPVDVITVASPILVPSSERSNKRRSAVNAPSRTLQFIVSPPLPPLEPLPRVPPVAVQDPPFLGPLVYNRFGTDLSIKINDEDRPLTAKERDNLILALAQIPTSHLQGITAINVGKAVIGSTGSGESNGSKLSISLDDPGKRDGRQVTGALLLAVGAHVYDGLSDADKKAYEYLGSFYNDKTGFKSIYMGWTLESEATFGNAAYSAQLGHPEILAQALQVISHFSLTNYQWPQLQSYSVDGQGKMTRTLLDGGYSANTKTLSVGDWIVGFENGKLASYGQSSPKEPSTIGPDGSTLIHARLASITQLAIPLEFPADILSAFGEIRS